MSSGDDEDVLLEEKKYKLYIYIKVFRATTCLNLKIPEYSACIKDQIEERPPVKISIIVMFEKLLYCNIALLLSFSAILESGKILA